MAPTTVPPSTTTTSIDIVPPQPDANAVGRDRQDSPDLSEFEQLVLDAGFEDELNDPTRRSRSSRRRNQAITPRPEPSTPPTSTNPAIVEAVLLTHVDDTQALLIDLLLALDRRFVTSPGRA